MTSGDIVNFPGEVHWQVWYQDTFDRECPRQIEVTGQGLQAGLIELWDRHLSETVQANGSHGFARFNLWLKDAQRSIMIDGDWDGLVRLRGWKQAVGRSFLKEVSRVHTALIQKGTNCDQICSVARDARSRLDFEQWLAEYR